MSKLQNAMSVFLLQVLASGHSDHCKAALVCSFHRDGFRVECRVDVGWSLGDWRSRP